MAALTDGDRIQGYLVGHPMAPDDERLAALLERADAISRAAS